MSKEAIANLMAELKTVAEAGLFPSDKGIETLALLIYERDKKPGYDLEMDAVHRGIAQGMKIMREIMGSYIHNK